jgi:hypothetical protein
MGYTHFWESTKELRPLKDTLRHPDCDRYLQRTVVLRERSTRQTTDGHRELHPLQRQGRVRLRNIFVRYYKRVGLLQDCKKTLPPRVLKTLYHREFQRLSTTESFKDSLLSWWLY